MLLSDTVEYQQDRKRTYKRYVEVRSRNHCCRTKSRIIVYSECASVALVIKHAKRIHHVVLSFVACLALPYFARYLRNGTIVGEKKLLNVKCPPEGIPTLT
jgi:hypothetical protein